MLNKIKVLIVDDSAIVRKVLTEQLGKHKNIEIVGAAPDPYIARDKIVQLNPDVITLDVEMPRMDGITFLEKLMAKFPLPVIILSTLTPAGCSMALRAFELGAIDVMEKPALDVSYKLNEMITQLVEKIEAAALAKERLKVNNPLMLKRSTIVSNSSAMIKTTDKIVAIGASTGGTEALRYILQQLPAAFPGIVIAQHMPANFTRSFADNLHSLCKIDVKEAEDNDTIRPGLALLAPGNFHMIVRRSGARYYVNVQDGPMVHHQRPAVDVLFSSVSKYVGTNAVGVILTGMGKDGAEGLLKMKNAGAYTLGQDEKSSIVYGMPKVAFELGAVEKVVSLENMATSLINLFN